MSDSITILTDSTFDQTLADSPVPVLVDFWAPWCGPCKAVAPILAELADELSGRLAFAKINVDEHQDAASRLKIRSIPCLVVFKGGEEISRIVGSRPKADLKAALEALA